MKMSKQWTGDERVRLAAIIAIEIKEIVGRGARDANEKYVKSLADLIIHLSLNVRPLGLFSHPANFPIHVSSNLTMTPKRSSAEQSKMTP